MEVLRQGSNTHTHSTPAYEPVRMVVLPRGSSYPLQRKGKGRKTGYEIPHTHLHSPSIYGFQSELLSHDKYPARLLLHRNSFGNMCVGYGIFSKKIKIQ